MARTTLTIEQRVNALEQRMQVVESERPGRKPMPLLAIRQRGVCAIEPDSDSKTCPYASIYRYQSGCHGDACRLRQHEAYERRKVNRPTKAVAATKKAPAKKFGDKKAPPFKKGGEPAKKQPAKKAAAPTARKVVAKRVTKRPSKRVATAA